MDIVPRLRGAVASRATETDPAPRYGAHLKAFNPEERLKEPPDFPAHLDYGLVPSSLYAAPAAKGVTTGAAAPTNSVRGKLENGAFALLFATHTLPDGSIATP